MRSIKHGDATDARPEETGVKIRVWARKINPDQGRKEAEGGEKSEACGFGMEITQISRQII